MECLNPARGDRRKVTDGIRYPFAVTSFGNTIYYTDWQRLASLFLGLWLDVQSPVIEAGLLEERERERERSEVRYKHLKSFMCLQTLWSFVPTQLILC